MPLLYKTWNAFFDAKAQEKKMVRSKPWPMVPSNHSTPPQEDILRALGISSPALSPAGTISFWSQGLETI
jgi:hypothetical protein